MYLLPFIFLFLPHTCILLISSVQSLSRVQLFATPWTAALQASPTPGAYSNHVRRVGNAIQPSNKVPIYFKSFFVSSSFLHPSNVEDVSCVTAFFSVWFNVVFSGFGIYRYLIHIFLLNNWCPGQGAVCGGCGVMAIKIFDLDVKFEVPINISHYRGP